jgi:hypothetical protein
MACAQSPGSFCDDPGGDYFTRLNLDRSRNRAIHQLQAMGYHVTRAARTWKEPG